MLMGKWQDQCWICEGTRFWISKTGYKVCMRCSGPDDPLAALVVLARRAGNAAVKRVESWIKEVQG